ncbi:hypothetical protein ACFV0T_02890 [Streptomyces sp. NPDC059582]|uniref:hypothetical protein n=1 Tax=Streptomyces sp. NPDC059582 TaxID=3346875 RepID=UPI00367ABF2B
MNLTPRITAALALAAAILTTLTSAGTARAAVGHADSRISVTAPVDEPEDVELDEAGRPDLRED